MRFAVLGPGGVGGFLAALLARAGDDVLVLAGDATSRAIASSGIHLESQRFGSFTVPVRAATRLSEPVDAVLVTVKATQLQESVDRVRPSALGDALVVPFLNGFEHVDILRRVYPPSHVVPATIRIETTKIAPGVISHTSPFAAIELGPGGETVAARLSAAGLDVRMAADEKAMLWDKFIVLGPLALLTTHARGNVGLIRIQRRDDLVALIGEVASVAASEGVKIDPAVILRIDDSVPDAMETSMQRDQAAGRALELDALGGALLRRAEKAGLDTPVTRRLVGEIKARSAASTSA
jgi:2-dehydropantoate 2-reductase